MKAIEHTSLALLAASLVLLGLIAAAFAFERYGTPVPIYVASPESKDFSFVRLVRDARSLPFLISSAFFRIGAAAEICCAILTFPTLPPPTRRFLGISLPPSQPLDTRSEHPSSWL